jgi:hypothetical protein
MSTTEQNTAPIEDVHVPRRKTRKGRTIVLAIAASIVTLVIGISIGHSSARTITKLGPERTVIKTHDVPGPTVTKQVPAPPPPAGTTLGTWSGAGNQVTPAFNPPSSGDYIVKWTFSGNVDPQLGQASNFIVSTTDSNAMGDGLPNVIQASSSGSTEVTGATGSAESFNVQATGSWTITVVSAP